MIPATKTPKITAILTVYNGENCVAAAVQSLLDQTEKDLEVLVVDDGSTDRTREVLEAIRDPRLKVIALPRTGRAGALGLACREAKGLYIANLDADDVSFPDRLEKQAAFLDSHPDCAWVGAGEEQEDDRRGEHHRRFYPLDDRSIRAQSAKCVPYCHSAVMFRESLIEEGFNYDPAQPFLIDFEFFLRVAERHKVANLPEVLVKRHVRGASYFQKNFRTSRQNFRLARLCAGAARRFHLSPFYYLFPLARLFYPWVPDGLKRLARGKLGLRETHEK